MTNLSSQYKQLTFQHANLKRPVKVILGTISSYLFSDKVASVCLFTTGGIIPVIETMEEVERVINAASAAQGEN